MGSSLIFALSIAGLSLLVFGERLGLPANMAALGVIGVLAFMGLGLSLASTTSRLNTFLHTRSELGFWGGICASAVLFVLILSFAIPPASAGLTGLSGFFTGFFAVSMLAPPQTASERHGARGNLVANGNLGRPDAERMIAILTGLAALHFILTLWPHILREVSAATGWNAGATRFVVLALAGLPAILGGLDGLMRVSGRVVLLCIALCLLPFAIEGMRQISPSASLSFLSGMVQEVLARPLPQRSDVISAFVTLVQTPNLILTGALSGLVLRMSGAALPLQSQRFMAPILGLAIAAGFLAAAWLTRAHLESVLLPSLTRLSPVDWPLFAFDPSLQGWLSVCGRVPSDAVDIAQACGSSTSPALAQFGLDRQLALPAIAAASGWPLLLGTVWNLAIPLFLVLGLGLCIHAAANSISENLLFRFLHPRALRAWRLAMARAVALAILTGLYFYPPDGRLFDERLMRTLALGIIILLAVSILSNWSRIMLAALVRRLGPRLRPAPQ